MFDMGFLELMIVSIVGLIVLGPDKLPAAIRTLAQWLGRFKRMASQFTEEIDRQVQLDELKKELKQQQESLSEQLQEPLNQQLNQQPNQQLHEQKRKALNLSQEIQPVSSVLNKS